MKLGFLTGFISGAIVFGAIVVFAAGLVATPNKYPIKLNNIAIDIEGYNINDNTYL